MDALPGGGFMTEEKQSTGLGDGITCVGDIAQRLCENRRFAIVSVLSLIHISEPTRPY